MCRANITPALAFVALAVGACQQDVPVQKREIVYLWRSELIDGDGPAIIAEFDTAYFGKENMFSACDQARRYLQSRMTDLDAAIFEAAGKPAPELLCSEVRPNLAIAR
jgi:hypothetical protein